MYTSRDYWALYQRAMARHLRVADPHERNLALADAHGYLGRWFDAVEREIQAQIVVARG